MNIRDAKEQIKQTINAYREKNEFGKAIIPIERQRPIFLIGAPGIGKTAIIEQIAQELGIGLVTYSMTHHTRQSALGLPFIVKKTYRGKEYQVSEYTMSEIIGAVYDQIENYGLQEGILFLDEINCVSETLAPSMLQFLQYKIFGRHKVPDGWIVVTAGNPPEYNNSVREFDIVTWDRLKRIDIKPDIEAWREYAIAHDVHPSVLSYLEIKKEDFYLVETTVDGKQFVTARGWVDLSDMIKLYEKLKYKVDENLVRQYLQNAKIAKSFAIYYDLFIKYKSTYQIESILAGTQPSYIDKRAQKAKFDERISLISLLLDAVSVEIRKTMDQDEMMLILMNSIKQKKEDLKDATAEKVVNILEKIEKSLEKTSFNAKETNSASEEKWKANLAASKVLYLMIQKINSESIEGCGKEPYSIIKDVFNTENANLKDSVRITKSKLDNLFSFCEKVFSDGQELLIVVTELTVRPYAAIFISRYGCDPYFRHNKNLLFYERQIEIVQQIKELRLD